MTLNASGKISIGGSTVGQSVNLEIDRTGTQRSSLQDDMIRIVAEKPTAGQRISLTNLWGKSYAYPSDSLWNNVILLTKFDGTNDSTVVSDLSPISTSLSNKDNLFKIKTGNYKFGKSSGYTSGSNTFIYSTNNETSYRLYSWVGSTKQNTYCTLEGWLYLPTQTGKREMIVSLGDLQIPTSNNRLNYMCFNLGTGGSVNISFNVAGDTSDSVQLNWGSSTGVPRDQWIHFCSQIAVKGNTNQFIFKTSDIIVKTAINGVYDTGNTFSQYGIITNTSWGSDNYVGYGGLRIGNIQRDTTVTLDGQLYIDEFRITKGSTSDAGWRYPDGVNFTPPNRPFATNT